MPHPSSDSAYGIWSLNEIRDAERGDNWPEVIYVGEHVYNTPGTYSWTAPVGVTSVSVVAVGAGSRASQGGNLYNGGGGGGLGWKNNITVVPGTSYTVVVGAGTSVNGHSYFIDTSTVAGFGGNVLTGGSYVGDGGGNGGNGERGEQYVADGSGGGAGGYSGNGGNGSRNGGGAGTGGAAGGGGFRSGGGVGIYGEGASGSAVGGGTGGRGGSGGQDASNSGAVGGNYGGGATTAYYSGGSGAVRIVWGPDRSFPTTSVDEESSDGNISTN